MRVINFGSGIATVALSALGMILGMTVARNFSFELEKVAHGGADSGQLTTRKLTINDAHGRRRILLAPGDAGGSGIWFYDGAEKVRLSLGLYEDGNAFIVLNDMKEQAVQIFRTVGEGTAPVLVMKAHGRDRIILGLNEGAKAEPFFAVYDENGNKKMVFGNY